VKRRGGNKAVLPADKGLRGRGGRPRQAAWDVCQGSQCAKWQGFTLFEVLVGLAVAAIAGSALLFSFAVSVRVTERAQLELAVLLTAQELLDEAGLDPLSPGKRRGQTRQGPFALDWERRVAATDLPGLHQVRVTVSSQQTGVQPLTLETYLSGL
jgi:type II secretion system protein I